MNKADKNSDRFRFALIGCGRISQTHLQALENQPDCELLAVADTRESAAKSVAEQYRCKSYGDYRQLLDGEAIDAVIICTPPSTHSEIALAFLDKGVHVLCEKPLAVTSVEAANMVDTAHQKDLLLMMASKFRYVDEVVRAKGIVESGILGEIVQFQNVFCGKVDMRNRWNADRALAGGGVVIDNGSHSVDIARYLLAPIDQIQAEEGKRVQGLEVEDTARMYFRTESNVLGSIDLSWSYHKEQESYIDLFGTEGALSVGWQCAKYRQSEQLNWVEFGDGYNKLAAFEGQLRNFIDSIRGKAMPLITAEDALASVRVIEAAYKSIGIDKWIAVERTNKTESAAMAGVGAE